MMSKLFLASFAVAAVMIFAVHSLNFHGSVPDFVAASGGGTLLDVKPSFNEDETYRRLALYGEAGRKNYAFRNRTVDLALPLSVFPFFLLLMLLSLRRISAPSFIRVALLSLPAVYVVFDLAENAAVLKLLEAFPTRVSSLAALLPYLTVIKRAASILNLVVPLIVFSFPFVRRQLIRTPRSA